MTAPVNVPVMVRKMVQFRDGSLGRKFSPKPRYFHTGFGGFSGLAAFASIGMSDLGAEEAFGCYLCQSWTLSAAMGGSFNLPLVPLGV